jgi:hypothetical protein
MMANVEAAGRRFVAQLQLVTADLLARHKRHWSDPPPREAIGAMHSQRASHGKFMQPTKFWRLILGRICGAGTH